MKKIRLTVETLTGCSIYEACNDAAKLAKDLDMQVSFKFNEVTCIASPTCNPRLLEDRYFEEMKKPEKKRKFVIH